MRRSRRPIQPQLSLKVEPLESRILLTCDLQLDAGTLSVDCGDEDNIVDIADQGGGGVVVHLGYRGGAARQEVFLGVARIDVALEGGNDDFSYRTNGPITPPPIGALSADLGRGNDGATFEVTQTYHPTHHFDLDVFANQGTNSVETVLDSLESNTAQINIVGGSDGWTHNLRQLLPGGGLEFDVAAGPDNAAPRIGHFHTLLPYGVASSVYTPGGDDHVEVRSLASTGLSSLAVDVFTHGGADEVVHDLVVDDPLQYLSLHTDIDGGAGTDVATTHLDFSALSATAFRGNYHIETHGAEESHFKAHAIPGFGDVDSEFVADPRAASGDDDDDDSDIWVLLGSGVEGTPHVSDLTLETSRDTDTAELMFAATDAVTGASVSLQREWDDGYWFLDFPSTRRNTDGLQLHASETAGGDASLETLVEGTTPSSHVDLQLSKLPNDGTSFLTTTGGTPLQTLRAQVDLSLADEISVVSEGYDQAQQHVHTAGANYVNVHAPVNGIAPVISLDAQEIAGEIEMFSDATTADVAFRDLDLQGRLNLDLAAQQIRRTLSGGDIHGTYYETFTGTDEPDDVQAYGDGSVMFLGATFDSHTHTGRSRDNYFYSHAFTMNLTEPPFLFPIETNIFADGGAGPGDQMELQLDLTGQEDFSAAIIRTELHSVNGDESLILDIKNAPHLGDIYSEIVTGPGGGTTIEPACQLWDLTGSSVHGGSAQSNLFVDNGPAALTIETTGSDAAAEGTLELLSGPGGEAELSVRDLDVEGTFDFLAVGVSSLTRILENASIPAGGFYSERIVGTQSDDWVQLTTRNLRIAPGAAFAQDVWLLGGNDHAVSSFNRMINRGMARILIDGGANDDRIHFESRNSIVRPGATTEVELFGQDGDDVIEASILNALIHGLYSLGISGGPDNDLIRARVLLHPLSTGQFIGSASGDEGVDELFLDPESLF